MDKKTLLSNNFRVLSELCKKVDDNNIVVINKSDIADETGLTRPTVMTCIDKLRTDGFIHMEAKDSTRAQISQEVIDLVFKMDPYSRDFKETLYDLIYEAAHSFCEKEKYNNTIIGYILYSLMNLDEIQDVIYPQNADTSEEQEVYEAIEVYLYLKYFGKSNTLSKFVKDALFSNNKNSDTKFGSSQQNSSYIFLDKIFNYEKIDLHSKSEDADILAYEIFKKFEGELEPNYLFQLSEQAQTRFVSTCIVIDIYLNEKLSFMNDSRANFFSQNSFVIAEDIDDVATEIKYLISNNFLSDSFNKINIHIIENNDYPYIINEDICAARNEKQNIIKKLKFNIEVKDEWIKRIVQESAEPINNKLLEEAMAKIEKEEILSINGMFDSVLKEMFPQKVNINKNNIYLISKDNFRNFDDIARELVEIPKASAYVFDGNQLAEGEEDHDIFEYLVMPHNTCSKSLNIISVSNKSTLTKPQIVKVKGFKKIKLTHYMNTVFKSKYTN